MKSVELERFTAGGITYIERRTVLKIMRDAAADLYEAQTDRHDVHQFQGQPPGQPRGAERIAAC